MKHAVLNGTSGARHEDPAAYPAIGSLAAIGDGRSLAVVANDGGIEWFCPFRFDAPPLVWPLLDRQRGGQLRVAPVATESGSVRYLDDTAVLEFEWKSGTGAARATLCMEWPGAIDAQHLLWEIEGLAGHLDIEASFAPRPDFGRSSPPIRESSGMLDLRADGERIVFQADCPMRSSGEGWVGRMTVGKGDRAFFALSVGDASVQSVPLSLSSIPRRIAATAAAWHDWSSELQWCGAYRQAVVRSAITLKLLIHEPTGAVVAAGTTSLPETLGGERNWDYRYTWFRDAGLTLSALFKLGCRHEAHRWAEWMEQTIQRHGTPLQVVYTVDGHRLPREETIAGIDGYRGSRPVRIGNAANSQFQLDIYGELLECVYICDSMADDAMRTHWSHMREAADFIANHWQEPDRGIWEIRTDSRHHVHSKAMAWAGMQRALWLQQRHGLDGNHEVWIRESERLRREVLTRGLSSNGRHFVRSYEEDTLDASLLLLARCGFIDGRSELFSNTVDAIRDELSVGADKGLILRYPADQPDGLKGTEGVFIICSFWLVEALVRTGRLEEATALFERLLTLQGDLGLYAEEMDVVGGEQLGNFPQAFSHVGLINAAFALHRDIDIPEAARIRLPKPQTGRLWRRK